MLTSHRLLTSKAATCGLLLFIALFALISSGFVQAAAPAASGEGHPIADGFTDAPVGTDEQGLYANWTGPIAIGDPGQSSSFILLKFDLNALTAGWQPSDQIEGARLNLAALPPLCGNESAFNLNVGLYGMPDSFDGWTEASIPGYVATATAALTATSVKPTVDEGTVNIASIGTTAQYFHWTDSAAGSFATWLQGQRSSGTTPGVVTLMLKIDAPAGTANSFVYFEDQEASGFNLLGCTGTTTPLQPILQVSGGGSPLSVTMSGTPVATSAPTWPLYAGLGAVALVVIAGLAVSRRRTA